MSHRIPLFIGSLLLLASCGSSVQMSYNLTSDVEDATRNGILFQATERVLTRRLAAVQVESPVVTVIPQGGNSATATISVPDSFAADVERITSDPFTFDIRVEEGTVKNEEGTEETIWSLTGVDGTMLEWIEPIQGANDNQVGVELQFTEEGRAKLATVFSKQKGRNIGIFVRDLLVSKLKINSDKPNERIIISGIPSEKVAQIFADDVNVGLHISFSASK